MDLYINGMACISPQHTLERHLFLPEIKEYNTNRMACVDAEYAAFFDAGSMRRMGRLMKFGTAAGLIALKDAGVTVPGAISTGTGLGLPEISQKFLRSIIEVEETTVSPTAFIQSTHNTVSSNIALLCGCHAHNNTFSHKGFSFESALTDALLLAAENTDHILVGAYDEVSDYKYAALKKAGELRPEPCPSLQLFDGAADGIIAGEGAAFFVLSQQAAGTTYCKFADVKTIYRPASSAVVTGAMNEFLFKNSLQVSDVDVVLSGLNGHAEHDALMIESCRLFNSGQTIAGFKHLCGEYMTSSAFACWLAAKIISTQLIPEATILSKGSRSPKNILIYNAHQHNHTLILFKAC